MPMSTTVLSSVLMNFSQVNSRYTTVPMTIAYTQAKAPASDGVNRPKRSPTIRITGKRKAQMEPTKVAPISFRDARCFRSAT